MGSKLGSLKVAANRVGASLEEYVERERNGERWCSIHKRWEPRELFNREKGRRDGLAPCCRDGKAIRNKVGRLKHRYGLTEHDVMLLLESQSNRCAICNEPLHNRPQIDHNHSTGKVRKILCFACNSIIGLAKENTAVLAAAIEYLEEYNGDH